MLEDGLEDVENLIEPEKEELKDVLLADIVSDNVWRKLFTDCK